MIDHATIVRQLRSHVAIVIDVRTDEERKEAHLVGSIHVPLQQLEKGQNPDLDMTKPIYIYCHSGVRADTAERILKKMGYVNVHNAGALDDLLEQ